MKDIAPEVIAAIIAALVTILISLINLIYSIITRHLDKKSERISQQKALSVQYITDKRVEWIYQVRLLVAEYVSTVIDLKQAKKGISVQNIKEYREKIRADYYKLKLYFNGYDKRDKMILGYMKHINDIILDGKNSKESNLRLVSDMNQLIAAAQNYLKLEWERCKLEVEVKYTDDEIKKKLAEIEDSFYQPN